MESTIEEQLTVLYRGHREAVERYVLRRAGPEEVGDVLAEVFLVAWRRFDRIPADPLPWLYGVARRALANDRRAARATPTWRTYWPSSRTGLMPDTRRRWPPAPTWPRPSAGSAPRTRKCCGWRCGRN
ncbi:RNA polymerase sigma factor [Streptomyces atacamensis]|uniref:RNA polymerase sigma factor n=1 Tax=Streptomyces atacamensis TaxID=531966 RepID=UPI00399CEDFF